AYLTRMVLRTFHGEPRSEYAAHEAGPLMRRPVQLLALATVLVGVIGLRRSWLPSWLRVPGEALTPQPGMTAVALGLTAAGALAGCSPRWPWRWSGGRRAAAAPAARRRHTRRARTATVHCGRSGRAAGALGRGLRHRCGAAGRAGAAAWSPRAGGRPGGRPAA